MMFCLSIAIASALPHLDLLEGGVAGAFASVVGRAVLRADGVEEDVGQAAARANVSGMDMHVLGIVRGPRRRWQETH